MAKAIVDRLGGRAVVIEQKKVWDGKETIYVLEHDKFDGKPRDGRGVHLGMFLQPAMAQLSEYDAGDYPYEGLRAYLERAQREELTLVLILIAIDAKDARRTRRMAAKAALANLTYKHVNDWITARFKATPIPAIADIQGVPNPKLKSFLEPFAAG